MQKILVFTYQCGEDVMIILCHHSHGESLKRESDKVEDSVREDVEMNRKTDIPFSTFYTHTDSLILSPVLTYTRTLLLRYHHFLLIGMLFVEP